MTTIEWTLHEESIEWTLHEDAPISWTVQVGVPPDSPGTGGDSLWEETTVAGDDYIAPIGGAAVLLAGAFVLENLTAPSGQTRPLVVDDAGLVAVGVVNSPNGIARLDGDGTLPDILGPSSWARDSEVDGKVATAVAALVGGAPGLLDTLDELAAALGDDPTFAAAMTAALAGKQPVSATLSLLAALSTTPTGRAVLEVADPAALRTLAGLGTAAVAALLNENNMASNSATAVPSQQSVKAYVDAHAASEWSEVARFTTATANDWPTFTSVPTADRYRLRWCRAVAATGSGGLTRNLTVNFDGDVTAGNYFNGATSASALSLAALPQGGGGHGEIVVARTQFNTLFGVVAESNSAQATSTGTSTRVSSSHSYRLAAGGVPPLSTWALAASNNDAWAEGWTFILETAELP